MGSPWFHLWAGPLVCPSAHRLVVFSTLVDSCGSHEFRQGYYLVHKTHQDAFKVDGRDRCKGGTYAG